MSSEVVSQDIAVIVAVIAGTSLCIAFACVLLRCGELGARPSTPPKRPTVDAAGERDGSASQLRAPLPQGDKSDPLDVVVVGGCAAGLATGACLDAAGVPNYVVIEANARCGDEWRNRYERLRLHDIAEECSLPFLPMPSTYPTFVPRLLLADYLDAYRAALRVRVLQPYRVTAIRRQQQQQQTGALWRVSVVAAEPAGEGGTAPPSTPPTITLHTKHIVFANGTYGAPRMPTIDGRSTFGGTVLHSSQYRSAPAHPRLLAGEKRVLVVGYGNSGAEIAMDLMEHGAHVTMLVRSRVNLVPRTLLPFLETIYHTCFPLLYVPFVVLLLPVVAVLVDLGAMVHCSIVLGSEKRTGVRRRWLPPFMSMLLDMNPPTQEGGALEAIRAGKMRVVQHEIVRYTPTGVVLSSGERIDALDGVVFCTGFGLLEPHVTLMDEADVRRIGGSGPAALRTGAISFFSGAVRAEPTVWFVFNRLQMINVLSRRVAEGIARRLFAAKTERAATADDAAALRRRLRLLRYRAPWRIGMINLAAATALTIAWLFHAAV